MRSRVTIYERGAGTRQSPRSELPECLDVVRPPLLEQSSTAMAETGKIFVSKANAIECLIQEISATGACLKLAAPHRVPPHFQFASRYGSPRTASVVWWDIEAVGIRFTGK